MKKSIFSCVISFILILSLSFSAFAAEITAEFSGLQGMFSNGYFGFCIDLDLKGATAGGGFTAAESTEVATNNVDGRDISQTLKIFFVTCFNDLFTVEESGECKINTSKAGTSVQGVIYNYSDNQSGQIWGAERKGYVEKIESYNGPAIPDEGHTITLDNGKIVTFYFMVIEPETEGVQSFFAVKAVASDAPAHVHNPAEKWESDDDNHWHECDCGEKFDEDSHKGTTADCKNPSVCEVCGKELGGTDSENHTGNTEIRNEKPVKELEDGYTGDKHCADCGELLEKGKIIPATHKHNPDKKWESDKDNHWHECICGEKSDKAIHSFVDGKCSICGFAAEMKDDTAADKEENADSDDADDNTTGDNTAGSDSNDGSDASIPETDSTDSDPDLIPDTDADSDKTDSEPETEITEEKPESEVADDKYESEIPNTGSDSLVFAVMFANLFAAILFFTCFKKKKTSKSES